MTLVVLNGLFWLLAAVAVVGGGVAVFSHDVMRMALGLGAFLLAVAGFFAYYGFGFLALAELFVYVGGVLVLVLFAIMLVQRTVAGVPDVTSRFDVLMLIVCAGLGGMLYAMLVPLAAIMTRGASAGAPKLLAASLLGGLLPQFELAGALLLVSLVAVVAIVGGDRE